MKMSGSDEKILLLMGMVLLTVAATAIDEDPTGFVRFGFIMGFQLKTNW